MMLGILGRILRIKIEIIECLIFGIWRTAFLFCDIKRVPGRIYIWVLAPGLVKIYTNPRQFVTQLSVRIAHVLLSQKLPLKHVFKPSC